MLLLKKHCRYFIRVLTAMPEPFTAYDSSHTSLVYFCIAGLALLDQLPQLYEHIPRQDCIEWVYKHLVASQEGFRASLSHAIPQECEFDSANLASTYFCLATLVALQDDQLSKRLDGHKIIQFVKNCQNPDTGSFSACYHSKLGRYGEEDIRQSHIACCIQTVLIHTGLLSIKTDSDILINRKLAVDYIFSTMSYDGAFSDNPGNEAHGGPTYCCLAALSLLGEPLSSTQLDSVTRWLAHRQIDPSEDRSAWSDPELGSRNGRTNKPGDTCYSFWIGASLGITGKYHEFSDAEAEKSVLLNHLQSDLIGGFRKTVDPEEYPDPLHSFFGLCALSIIDHKGLGLKPLQLSLCIPQDLYEGMASVVN